MRKAVICKLSIFTIILYTRQHIFDLRIRKIIIDKSFLVKKYCHKSYGSFAEKNGFYAPPFGVIKFDDNDIIFDDKVITFDDAETSKVLAEIYVPIQNSSKTLIFWSKNCVLRWF